MTVFEDIVVKDGRMYGGWRRPINTAIGARASIHNDETARSVGMRGGTIPGTVHLNLFAPLFVKLWGQRWFERGSLSMYYTYATLDREEVRAVIALPPEGAKDVQVEACVEMPDGRTVAEGTVSVGDAKEVSHLQGLELTNAKPEELRILASLKAGDELPSRDVLATQESIDRGLETITDPLDWYKGSSPWGPSIVNPAAMYGAMMLTPTRPDGKPFSAVGFFGATEVRNVNGPIKVGVPYRAKGKLVCVGTSSRTEYYWYDSYLEERDSGKRVAEMRKMLRYMKAGSPYYQDTKE
jgi:hypothetical protein